MNETSIPFEPRFGAFVIESLTLGMYGESRNAIREYVQNAFDSLRQAIDDDIVNASDARVDVEMDADRNGLTIRDNGVGLRTENAADILAAVGVSNKDYRNNAGFRGIGRLAGIVFCDSLIFTTKARGQKEETKVVFDAAKLRERLSPEASYDKGAAETLAECVTASRRENPKLEDHYFQVRLDGFFEPPEECVDVEALRTYLGQVAPLPYDPAFRFADKILEEGRNSNMPIESVSLFIKDGGHASQELFKPYCDTVLVRGPRAEISRVDFYRSPTGRWWGWVARKRQSGAIKDAWAGLRVRIRNIQIDDTKVMRDIFAESSLTDKPRRSYARLTDWYAGEIFIDPRAAIPNARRDGFEENPSWQQIRNELDNVVATPLGKQAYRLSKESRVSVANLMEAMETLGNAVELLEAEDNPDTSLVDPQLEASTSLRKRISEGLSIAEPEEKEAYEALAAERMSLQKRLEIIHSQVPVHSCDEEVAEALDFMAKQLDKALRERLAPQEWRKAKAIVDEVMALSLS